MSDPFAALIARFGPALLRGEPLARHTVARLGGPADALLTVHNGPDLVEAVSLAHAGAVPWIVLGGGANVLIADAGFRGLVIVNRADGVDFADDGSVSADSGVNLSTLARQCMARGLAGLEWAVNVPGTVGGAVINNAGAHGGDMAALVRSIDVLRLDDPPARETWPVERMGYAYRYSILKGSRGQWVVLGAALALAPGHDPAALNDRASEFVRRRKATQPPGASLGSIFKNPPDAHAGRLIEAAGLKGKRLGGVEISTVHANFIVNTGGGTASDYRALIEQARAAVLDQFGIELELEIELIGVWED